MHLPFAGGGFSDSCVVVPTMQAEDSEELLCFSFSLRPSLNMEFKSAIHETKDTTIESSSYLGQYENDCGGEIELNLLF